MISTLPQCILRIRVWAVPRKSPDDLYELFLHPSNVIGSPTYRIRMAIVEWRRLSSIKNDRPAVAYVETPYKLRKVGVDVQPRHIGLAETERFA